MLLRSITLFIAANTVSCIIITDDRIRSLDETPSLGRGYSLMTNKLSFICLHVEEETAPSFNFDCKYRIDNGTRSLVLDSMLISDF